MRVKFTSEAGVINPASFLFIKVNGFLLRTHLSHRKRTGLARHWTLALKLLFLLVTREYGLVDTVLANVWHKNIFFDLTCTLWKESYYASASASSINFRKA